VRIYFYSLRVRSASLAELRMRICYQNNGGSSISKRENQTLEGFFSQLCTCFAWGATDSDKVSFYLFIHVKITEFHEGCNGIASFGCSSYGLQPCFELS
jgi:hypothetical protein